ncbi:unnamed protein product [Cuscuta europaea]|uniref:tRNA (guanine-N(7)-)-methyltransferase non-catalytic subunit n=1 Tax=Cuscuta europaea TaxID=41803 RepID=A0A9P0YSX5_CUSEU|nr:unnamed protein product [Cuscuta europaea]
MEETNMEDAEQNRETEVAPALIAIHPTQESVAVSVGSDLRVFNIRGHSESLLDNSAGDVHKDSIRAIRYGAEGKLFVSAGDDKLVKIWVTDSWKCTHTILSEKRVSAVAISKDGCLVCFADKFGVVYATNLEFFQEKKEDILNKKPVPILSHYCSIVTSLEFSPDGRFIVSADRDYKIRVTVFPQNPLNGAHEIQSFCLGHTEFVSCLTFVCNQEFAQGFLVSGGGDSSVRLWDYLSGSLLDTCLVGAQAGVAQSNGSEEDFVPAITDICATPDGSLIAVAVQSFPGVMLMTCELSTRNLSVFKVVPVVGPETFIPTSLGAATMSADLLWLVMGVSGLNAESAGGSLVRVRVLSGFRKRADKETLFLDDKDVPGGEETIEKLQGGLCIKTEAFVAAAEAVKTAMRNLFIKKQYSADRREFRKRGRNDRKGMK